MDVDFNIKEIHKIAPIAQLVEQLICNQWVTPNQLKTYHKFP